MADGKVAAARQERDQEAAWGCGGEMLCRSGRVCNKHGVRGDVWAVKDRRLCASECSRGIVRKNQRGMQVVWHRLGNHLHKRT